MGTPTAHVSEVALTIQFASMGDLTFLQLAEIYSLYQDEFPIIQQLPTAPPMSLDQPELSIAFVGQERILPRIWLLTPDLHRLVQIQHDRISLNWRKVDSPSADVGYPGYSFMIEELFRLFAKLQVWYKSKQGEDLQPSIAELVYINTIPMKIGDTRRRISDVFSFYVPSQPGRPISGFSTSWGEQVSEPTGNIQIQATAGIAVNNEPVAMLTLVCKFDVSAPSYDLRIGFNAVHDKLLEWFKSIITL